MGRVGGKEGEGLLFNVKRRRELELESHINVSPHSKFTPSQNSQFQVAKEKEKNCGVATLALQSSLLTPRFRKVGYRDLQIKEGKYKKIRMCVKIEIVSIKLECLLTLYIV